MSSCSHCDAPVASEDRFCGNCGLPTGTLGGPRPDAGVSAQTPAFSSDPAHGRGEAPPAVAPADRGATTAPNNDEGGARGPESQDLSDQFQPTIVDAQASRRARPSQESAGGAAAAPAPEAQQQQASAPPTAESEGGAASPADAAAPGGPASAELPASAGLPGATTGDQSPTSRRGRTGSTDGRRRSASSALEAGTLLNNRYEIVRKIGGGGMGAVYYAKDKNLGDAPRAVKEMIQSHLDESQQEKAVADFKRESMLLASLEHPSIPTIYDYFYDETASRFYLVMRYISGGDFLARLRNAPQGRIDERSVTDWAAQVADVLDYLHNRRPPIIYRDLKPANLMIDGNNGRVMLIDFGIARWVAPQEKGVTAVGTMGYAPPELFSGKVEPRSDVYSLGATMFHLLTGADPQDNPLLIFDFTKNPRPREINPAVSNEMEQILMRAVEYSVEMRFRSAAEMRDTLHQHAERLRAGAVTYGVVQGGGASQPLDAQTIATETVFCGFCGKSIAADDVFCAHCGARQPIVAASASLRAARATARLVVSGTTELDSTFMLHKDSTLVGRTDPQSNIFPDVDLSRFDPETKISRRHARVFREGDTFLVEDLGSVNGTVINEAVRLGPRQPRPLANGDRLRLGETTLHFLVG
jgi:eukaryotic-like serine/threonine-protein kinase